MKKQNYIVSSVFYLLAVTAMSICLPPGCAPPKNAPVAAATSLVEKISSGPIEVTIIAEPAQVHLDRDILLTLRVCAPSNIEVHIPPLADRLKGFVLNGDFTRDGPAAGKPVKEYCFRLTPTLADEYRIAPLAITWTNHGATPPAGGWFASRPVVFQAAAVAKDQPGATINDIIAPVWIYPPFQIVAFGLGAIVGAIGAVYFLWRLSRRIHRAIKLRRMSPKERALYELNELLAQDLIGKNKIKEFYLELTMIVRRYIERAHAIRAPEQTTEEFLAAASKNPEFSQEVVRKLRAFLQTADLVKFAVYRPEHKIIDQTIATARDYINTDEQLQSRASGIEKKRVG